ncbi:MAG: hypothetical protein GDA52_07155 [Rhodobacteraceae bacterium]|nr:hypothetical protein [Paracoccaceae bacterium]
MRTMTHAVFFAWPELGMMDIAATRQRQPVLSCGLSVQKSAVAGSGRGFL